MSPLKNSRELNVVLNILVKKLENLALDADWYHMVSFQYVFWSLIIGS